MSKRVPAVWQAVKPWVAHKSQYRRQKYKRRSGKADNNFNCEDEKFLDFKAAGLCEHYHKVVHYNEQNLSDKEVVVYNAGGKHRNCKHNTLFVIYE